MPDSRLKARTDDDNAYVPENGPAIGDLMNLFTFDHDGDDHDRHHGGDRH